MDNLCGLTQSILCRAKTAKFFLYPLLIIIVYVIDDASPISEQLDIINTAFKVIDTIRPKLACSRCDVIVQAPLLPNPIERGYASAGLLARILVSKYVEHIPLYRQSEIYARQGVVLSRNTMVRWVSKIADNSAE